MLFDTDIFIWVQRGNAKAAYLIEHTEERYLSAQTYMELLQGAQNRKQHQEIKEFLMTFSFDVLRFTENIGHRACVYIEEYALSNGLRAGDAIVAATATENSLTLVTSNAKHFRSIKDLRLKVFKP
ncbi:MAG: VapC toxin family PIN domain ribonuclease [Syntrophus sp. (in: bacteria)]|nr:VapC toxin family PIN domain ribonuclease [Syntrophus sp. (in: bacteria)]